jgi:hypothetical protein
LFTEGSSKDETSQFVNGDELMMEVNMDASPRTLHFFRNTKHELPFFINIPSSINFAVFPFSVEVSFRLPLSLSVEFLLH